MSQDTTNALDDVDLAVAISESAINSQLHLAWKAWKHRAGTGFEDEIDLMVTKKDGKVVPSDYGLTARLAAPTVDLDVPHALDGQVAVTLTLHSGTVTYFDEGSEGPAEATVADWTVTFLTEVTSRPVTLTELATIDPDAHATVVDSVATAQAQDPALGDDAFSIEFLFLRFGETELVLNGDTRNSIPPDVPTSARDRALSALTILLNGDLREYALGTVVRRARPSAEPTFALTDMVLDVQRDPAASTLVHLGMLDHRPLPADLDGTRRRLGSRWVDPGALDGSEATVSGTMALSRGALLDRWLVERTAAFLGASSRTDGASGWTFEQEIPGADEDTDLPIAGSVRFRSGGRWQLHLAVRPGTPELTVTGRVDGTADIEVYGPDLPLVGRSRLGAHSAAGHHDLTGTIIFTARGAGAALELSPGVGVHAGDLVVDRADDEGIETADSVFQSAFKTLGLLDHTPHELVDDIARSGVDMLTTQLAERLEALSVAMHDHAFVPPGGGVYVMARPRFSGAGDLLLDVTYQMP